MTRDQMLADIYARLTSRKLGLAVLSIAFAYWNYHLGDLTAQQFQQAVMVAVTAYTAAEGVADAFAAWKPAHKAPDAVVTTNVDASPAPADPAPAAEPRRVRPSRASKVKAVEVKA